MTQTSSSLGRFATRHALAITFIALVLCLAGVVAALRLPSSVYPQTDFPRVVVLVNNGIMPASEMMATITRPIEEAMKGVPGVTTVRSATARGTAQINLFFRWNVDMVQSELYVLGRLSEIRADLPATAATEVSRVTFSAFPIIGISLTSSNRDLMDLWETANYQLKPRFLQIPGVAKVELTGGHVPEYHVIVDPLKLQAAHLGLTDVSDALTKNNLIAPAGMIEENYHLYLTTVDGRVHSPADIGNVVIVVNAGHPVRLQDVARVERGPQPAYTVVTAQGQNAVLLNVQSQPDGSTLKIASALKAQLQQIKAELPPDMHLAFFYDQSLFVSDSVGSVRDAIIFGLILSVLILYFFLKNWGSVWTAVVTIPISVLITFVAMKLAGMSFNMMTLGGIAAAIGLIIDNAIIVVEAMCFKIAAGRPRLAGIQEAVGEFFRALALTMVVSLLTSLVLAITLTPSLAAWFIRERRGNASSPKVPATPPSPAEPAAPGGELERTGDEASPTPSATGASQLRTPPPHEEGGFILKRVLRLYEATARWSFRHWGLTLLACGVILASSVLVYRQLATDFLPAFDEGGFVIDYNAPPGTSLTETSRQLDQAEAIIRANPDVESYSRRLGTQLGLFITEPYSGDFLVKLKPTRAPPTDEVITLFRQELNQRFPAIRWDFPGILTDLIGDLQMTPQPIEIKLFSPDLAWLKQIAPRVQEQIKKIPGVVDTFDGLTETGPSINLRVRPVDAARFGLTAQDIADAVNTALLGQVASSVLEGDRVINLRVVADPHSVKDTAALHELPIRTPN